MHSIKTAVVVSILLVVGYAVYTTLNNERLAGTPSAARDDWPSAAKADLPEGPGTPRPDPFRQNGKSLASTGASGPRRPWETGASVGGGPNGTAPEFSRTRPALPPGPDSPAVENPRAPRPATSRQVVEDVRPEFRAVVEAAEREIGTGSLVKVLRDLTPLYGRADLSADESRQLTELLSQLAGEVIYSRKHYLQPAYVVQEGDSLQQIAQQCRVPWQLLAKINGVQDPDRPAPGTKLKVLRGPFDAIVFVDRYELVVQVEGLYAGRFPIGVGRDQPRLEGTYAVRKKMTRPTYYGPTGSIDPGDPDNPLGRLLIGLDEQIAIHGTNDMRNLRRADGRGTICLGDRDIEDVYDILLAESPSCPGSRVTICRSEDSRAEVAERGAGISRQR